MYINKNGEQLSDNGFMEGDVSYPPGWISLASDTEREAIGITIGPDPIVDISEAIRRDRNIKLAATDWTQCKDIPDTIATLWQPYRQALRDITKQKGFPKSVKWPVIPA